MIAAGKTPRTNVPDPLFRDLSDAWKSDQLGDAQADRIAVHTTAADALNIIQ